ncbi:phage holin family protein [Ferruginibacter yonginensis]|uniref:Phage holin family protein n=1 Tax=Ferruginibacter yonginensis TaxID=1310416 RepID=A0ABV8QRQ7_9BACT
MNLLLRLLFSGLIVFVLSKILSGIHINTFFTALIFAVAVAALNAIVKPIFILLTLPITVFTMGLFLFVINAIIILLADALVDGIKVDGFWWALLFSIILSIFSSAIQKALDKQE